MSTDSRAIVKRSQRGAIMMIGMVMLLMLILVTVGVIRLSTRHTQVVSNEQVRTEAVAAANYALDTVLNQAYSSIGWAAKYKGIGSTVNVNLGIKQSADPVDGTDTVPVTVSNLVCKRGRVLKNSELFDPSGQVTNAQDKTCIYQAPNPGLTIGNSTTGDKSLCGNALWEMQAQVNSADPTLLAASVAVAQGVEVRVLATDVDSACK